MITSIRNPKIQLIRDLQRHGRERKSQNAFLLEGVRLVEEAWQTGWPLRAVLYSPEITERGAKLLAEVRDQSVEVEEVSPEVMRAVCETETPQGILAVAKIPEPSPLRDASFLPVLDGIRDPGNAGTLLRAAAAAGAMDVILTPGTVDPFSPKVVRSAMGAHFRLNFHDLTWDQIESELRKLEPAVQILLADVRKGVPYWQADLKKPTALVISNEAEGASREARFLADDCIHIPMPGKFESLNAASAGSILFFEVVRQRQV